ncbi:hypothetical protein HW115_04765 [Verrucomicrobiaceae bacterium N1E253]|uniref:Uncharacterized protein n=1 Tax=Oceaniferula marina TaxID=2748318 RepID=A0A851GCK3_9BACT|nr:hypothetical protein [Oceaniferula marina]NWK54909.1 hypothetical protein [Oceaniferula marina]
MQAYLFTLLIALLFGASSISAENLSSYVQRANQAWVDKDYRSCQRTLEHVVDVYGQRGRVVMGSKFGEIYYKKGLAELKLAMQERKRGDETLARRWFSMAAESFQICYERYPNE